MGKDGRVELIPRLSFSFVTGRLSNVIAALLSILLHLIASSVWPPLSLSFSLFATFHEFDRFEKEPLHPVKSSNIRMKRWGGFRMIFNKHPDRTARCTARPLDSRLETAEEREREGERALGRFVYGLNHSMSTKLTDGQALHRTYYVRSTWNKATPLFRAVNNPLGPTWRTGQGAAQLEKAAWKPGNRCPTGVRHPREEKGREGEGKREKGKRHSIPSTNRDGRKDSLPSLPILELSPSFLSTIFSTIRGNFGEEERKKKIYIPNGIR